MITYIRHYLWDFLPCKKVYDNIIYKYKYATDFAHAGIKLLNTEMKENKNGHTGDLIEHTGLFICKVAYSSYDAPLFPL
jgi:hypothetical protein